jgi:hypothetical protein
MAFRPTKTLGTGKLSVDAESSGIKIIHSGHGWRGVAEQIRSLVAAVPAIRLSEIGCTRVRPEQAGERILAAWRGLRFDSVIGSLGGCPSPDASCQYSHWTLVER